jgi:hypothetical protein
MNIDKLKVGLASKVDSFEKWKELAALVGFNPERPTVGLPEYGYRMRFPADRDYGELGNPNHLPVQSRWWMEREVLRAAHGVYPEVTSVLENLVNSFGLQQHFIHISAEDPNMVAYTASVEDGQRDKQVRLSFGKLIRKLLLVCTDDHIRELETSHRSELDPTFEIARTEDEIGHVYMHMEGDTGCMRYGPEQWGFPKGSHPSHAYAYAGLGVAYTKDGDRIKSRSVIFENPTDPTDKRYVRIYGDGALKRKLERAGYKCRSLEGAKLKAIELEKLAKQSGRWGKGVYMVPYLDGPAGNQNGSYDGAYGYILKGEDCIRLITQHAAERMANMGFATKKFKGTDGTYNIPTIDPERLQFTCALTGKVVNTLEQDALSFWHEGKVIQVASDAISGMVLDSVRSLDSATAKIINVHFNTGDKPPMFVDRVRIGGVWIDTPVNREHCGYARLDATLYPSEQEWLEVRKLYRTPDSTYIKPTDAYLVFDETGEKRHVHAGQVDALKKSRKYVSTAPIGTTKALSHTANPNLHTTVGGRKVVSGQHQIVQLWDGQWEYVTNARATYLFDFCTHVTGSIENADIHLSKEWLMRNMFKERIEYVELDYGNARDRTTKLKATTREQLQYQFCGYSFFMRDDAVCKMADYNRATYDNMHKAAAKLKSMTDQELSDMFYPDLVKIARGWEKNANTMFEIVDEAVARWQAAEGVPVEVHGTAAVHETSYAVAA